MEQILITLASQLANLIASTSQEYVSTKLQQAKSSKDLSKAEPIYDELINKLLSDKQDALRIASQYREQLDKTFLPDTDIKYLENTFLNLIALFQENENQNSKLSNDGKTSSQNSLLDAETAEQITNLINTETLKSMQLLGFDFKKALGEPVTEGVKKIIESKFKDMNKASLHSQQKVHIPDIYVYRANIYQDIEQGDKIVYILKIPAYGNLTVRSETITDLEQKSINTLAFFLYQNGWSIQDSDFTDQELVDHAAYAHTLITIDVNYARSNYNVPEKS